MLHQVEKDNSDIFDSHQVTDPWTYIHNYELQGIVSHSGSMWGGHYVSYVSRYIDGTKKWFYISDAMVKEISEENLKSVEAYILFYFKLK